MPGSANAPRSGSGCWREAPRPARRKPPGRLASSRRIVLGGLLISLLFLGDQGVQMTLGLPSALTRIFQGILPFFLLFIFYRVRLVRPAPDTHALETA